MLYSDVVGYQHFGGPCCLHFHVEVKMDATRSSETLVSYHFIAWCLNPKDHDLNLFEAFSGLGICLYLEFGKCSSGQLCQC
jgi:hypothetical protein